MSRMRVITGLAAVVLSASLAMGQWVEPTDGNLTEKQVEGFIGVLNDLKAASKSGEGQGLMGAMMAAASGGDAFNATLAKNGLDAAEFGWVSQKVIEAWGAAMAQDASAGMESSMDTAITDAQKQVEEAKTTLTEAQDALKSAADDAGKAEAELNVEEAEANLEFAQASLNLMKAQGKLMQVQAKRMKAGSSGSNVEIVRKYLKQIEETSGEDTGDADDEEGPADTSNEQQ